MFVWTFVGLSSGLAAAWPPASPAFAASKAEVDDEEESGQPQPAAGTAGGGEEQESPWYLDISGFWSQPLSKGARAASQVATSDYLACCFLGSSITVDAGHEISEHFGVGITETYVPGTGLFDPAAGLNFYDRLGEAFELEGFLYADLPLTGESRDIDETTAIIAGVSPVYYVGGWKLGLDALYSVGVFSHAPSASDPVRETSEREVSLNISYQVTHRLGLTAKGSLARLALSRGGDLYLAQIACPGVTYKWSGVTFSASYVQTSLDTKFKAPDLPFFEVGASYAVH
jgi:hypothetical protein